MNLLSVVRETAQSMGIMDANGQFVQFDSILVIDFVLALEETTGMEIPTDSLLADTFQSPETVVAVLELIRDREGTAA